MAWKDAEDALKEARTDKEKAEAAEIVGAHIAPQEQDKFMVTMQKGGVNAVRLRNLNKAMKESPEVYERVKKIIGGD